MVGSMQARVRASLQADLQSEIHWEMRDCLTAGFRLSPSAPLSACLPFLLCFGEMFGIEALVPECSSGQLLLRWRERSGLEAWGMLWALARAWHSHMPPCCFLNLPSLNAPLIPPGRLSWCPYRYSRGSELPNVSSPSSSFPLPSCISMTCPSSVGSNPKVPDGVPLSRDSRSLWCTASSCRVWLL